MREDGGDWKEVVLGWWGIFGRWSAKSFCFVFFVYLCTRFRSEGNRPGVLQVIVAEIKPSNLIRIMPAEEM